MLKYILKRLGLCVLILLGVSLIIYVLIRCMPVSFIDDKIAQIVKNREYTMSELKKLGFTCTDSKANFVFVSHNKIPASTLAAELRKKGILIRYFNKAKIDNYLRITIGSMEEMQTLVAAIKEITEG